MRPRHILFIGSPGSSRCGSLREHTFAALVATPGSRSPGSPTTGATNREPTGILRPQSANGLWRSLVAHLAGGQGVVGSNPASPTNEHP